MSLLINKNTEVQLASLAKDPPHALLLVGLSGIGKLTLAQNFAKNFCKIPEIIEPDEKGTISIDTIRSLYRRTSVKQHETQAVIIDHAECLGTEAQNAFLKLLEEPRKNVLFILTSPSVEALLPTITSRVQTVQVWPLNDEILKDWLNSNKPNFSDQEKAQLLFIAQGRPATLAKIANDKNALEQYKQTMQQAKHLLTANSYERLVKVNQLTKDKTALFATLESMVTITQVQLMKNPSAVWISAANALERCLSSISKNGNPRAQLVQLFLSY